ncbi:HAMP domain-containing protein [Paenibacillus sp. EKM102P]|uniref:methyl-accepting chemotaxis protein n=1 Tax=unclassified Paenibacillus TaxID=185978 RepID=UPI00142E01C0|nr:MULTISPECIES: HAMP domain-containing methyl-accepting chemotaxis protein [unclassified Paenibacillus]KAF6619385.1 HAMP domain-containing protein [Paenibacillus sp. EKM101P]KAF6624477.1 HAMP domain-containing protein [Paenibacillus sp. EKM102P]KAF6635745.1 HAMP domain-containing protein [Paenibacillus sp. EKM10P]KAF6648547.1 HAMP domain-containing protein [Paenibacillus sp. EKM11P]
MKRFNRSLGAKLRIMFLLIQLFASLLFSISFYAVSMSIINSSVMPQVDQLLETGAKNVYQDLNISLAVQAGQGSGSGSSSAMQMEAYLQDKVDTLKLESAYIAVLKDDGKAEVVARNVKSAYKVKDTLVPVEDIKKAKQGEMNISDIYSDSHGVHKTAFFAISGSNLILGVNEDVGFVQEKSQQILWICIGITLVTLILGGVISTLVIRKVVQPIAELVRHSEKIAQGDLSQDTKVQGVNEIAQLARSFQSMSLNLKEMIGHVLTTSGAVVKGSDELLRRTEAMSVKVQDSTAAAEEVAKGSNSIASAAAENAQAMEEIAQGVQHIASSANDVSDQISEATKETVNGNTLAQKAVAQMSQVGHAADESLRYIHSMNERSEAIGSIVSAIFDITKQIQMLSLNASIEAARAGEHGRGFAVVAGEVRKLAEQSKAATQEISDYLVTIQEVSQQSVDSVTQVSREIHSGTEMVQQASFAFNQLSELMQKINATIQTVSAATEQVSASSEEVSASVEETALIAANAQHTIQEIGLNADEQLNEMESHSEVVRQLSQQATELQKAVQKFKIK